jgi:hypothetical protein
MLKRPDVDLFKHFFGFNDSKLESLDVLSIHEKIFKKYESFRYCIDDYESVRII